MKTSYAEKLHYITEGSCIGRDLLDAFGRTSISILDCGACDGLDSIIYSKLLPSATIHAIEPRFDNFEELRDNIALFKASNIRPINACLSDAEGEVTFYSSFGESGSKKQWDTGNKSSSLLRPKEHLNEHKWCQFTEEKIKTVRFDSLGIEKIDFIHLDVQGAEVKVLKGMGKVLDSVKMIWAEVASIELYEGQPLVSDVEKFLSLSGFTLKRSTCKKFGDQLWVR